MEDLVKKIESTEDKTLSDKNLKTLLMFGKQEIGWKATLLSQLSAIFVGIVLSVNSEILFSIIMISLGVFMYVVALLAKIIAIKSLNKDLYKAYRKMEFDKAYGILQEEILDNENRYYYRYLSDLIWLEFAYKKDNVTALKYIEILKEKSQAHYKVFKELEKELNKEA